MGGILGHGKLNHCWRTDYLADELSPIIQGPYNSQIVRRSWGILETSDPSSRVLSYGGEFTYNEFMTMKGPISAIVTSLSLLIGFTFLGELVRHSFPRHSWLDSSPSPILLPLAFETDPSHATSAALFSPLRWAVRKWGPQPGTGPSKEMQETGWFKVVTTAKSVDGKHEAQMVMKGKGDPVSFPSRSSFRHRPLKLILHSPQGYAATAKMITECALAIVLDYDRLPPLAKQGGPLTPATALGTVLVERLENSGFFSFSAGEGKKIE